MNDFLSQVIRAEMVGDWSTWEQVWKDAPVSRILRAVVERLDHSMPAGERRTFIRKFLEVASSREDLSTIWPRYEVWLKGAVRSRIEDTGVKLPYSSQHRSHRSYEIYEHQMQMKLNVSAQEAVRWDMGNEEAAMALEQAQVILPWETMREAMLRIAQAPEPCYNAPHRTEDDV